MIFNYLAVS